MFLATILTPDVTDSLIVLAFIAVCALPFCLGHILAMQAPSTVRQPDPGEDEGRPRPRGIRPRGFQVQAAGAAAPADVEEAERQRVAARIKAEEDQRSQRHAGWEKLVPGVPCLRYRITGAMAMPQLVQPQAEVFPPARVQ
jgi:hypothetical protein